MRKYSYSRVKRAQSRGGKVNLYSKECRIKDQLIIEFCVMGKNELFLHFLSFKSPSYTLFLVDKQVCGLKIKVLGATHYSDLAR